MQERFPLVQVFLETFHGAFTASAVRALGRTVCRAREHIPLLGIEIFSEDWLYNARVLKRGSSRHLSDVYATESILSLNSVSR